MQFEFVPITGEVMQFEFMPVTGFLSLRLATVIQLSSSENGLGGGAAACVIRPRGGSWVGVGVGGFVGMLWLVASVLVVGVDSG